jgi:protein SCO1/2
VPLLLATCFSLLLALEGPGADRRAASGLVLEVDRSRGRVTISCDAGPGFTLAVVQSFTSSHPPELVGLRVGTFVDFWRVGGARIEGIRTRGTPSSDPQALEAERLKLLDQITAAEAPEPPLALGLPAPDFTLTNQDGEPVTLSRFAGKVVAVSFMYTSCHSPDFCFRLTNNFGLLQRRFGSRLGRDLVLLTITFDPVHDQPEVLARYGATWKADSRGWHLLTGPAPDVRRICRTFGMNAWPDMGMITHDLRTAVIDREGRLWANLEGNYFSAQQLGDLLEAAMGWASTAR